MEIDLVKQFKAYYSDFGTCDLCKLDSLYSQDVLFIDPIHQIHGITALQDYMVNMSANLEECRFEYLDENVGRDVAYIKWIMHFRHVRLGNKLISVRGVTHIQYRDKINFHEDIYDMGEMLYEHLPVMGRVVHWLKRRLGE